MMEVIKFDIDSDNWIEFVIEGSQANGLNSFDPCKIYADYEGKRVLVFDDFLVEGISSFVQVLKLLKEKKYSSKEERMKLGESYHYNKDLYYEKDRGFLSSIWEYVGGENFQNVTWLYQTEGKNYLEIGSLYPYLFLEVSDEQLSFEKFINNYPLVKIIEIPDDIVRHWLKSAEKVRGELIK